MIGHDDPRHGSDRGYSAGCRQACCRGAHAAAMWAYRQDRRPRLVDVAPLTRRLDALACLGWSRQHLSRRLGMSRGYLRHVDSNPTCLKSTADKIKALYDELRDLPCTEPTANRTRELAARRGAVAPHTWFDIDRGLLLTAHLPEKPCGCHPRMPLERTLDGFVCKGCGWGAFGAAS